MGKRYAYCSYPFTGNTPTIFAIYEDLKDAENRFHGGGNYSAIVFDTERKVLCLGTQDRGNRGAGPGGTYLDQPLVYDTGLTVSIDTALNYVEACVALGAAAVATGGVAAVVAASSAIGALGASGDMTTELLNNSNVGRLVALCEEKFGLAKWDPALENRFRDAIGRYALVSFTMTGNKPYLFARYDCLEEAEDRFHEGGNYSMVIYDTKKHCVARGKQDRGSGGPGAGGSYLHELLMYDTGIGISLGEVKAVLNVASAVYKIKDVCKLELASEVEEAWTNLADSSFSLLTTLAENDLCNSNVDRLLKFCASKGW